MQAPTTNYETPTQHRHLETRKLGCSTFLGKSSDPPSWSVLLDFVNQLDEACKSSLSAFSLAVATHYYSAAGVQAESRVGFSLGLMDRNDFWQTDVLAGLLMQALMLLAVREESSGSIMRCFANLSANIKFDADELDSRLLMVQEAESQVSGTEWSALYWNFLRIVTERKYADSASDDQSAPSIHLENLVSELCASFATGQQDLAEAVVRKERFWRQDCLATALFEALRVYLNVNQAFMNGQMIQKWLSSSRPADTVRKLQAGGLPAAVSDGSMILADQQQAAVVEPIDASTLQSAISDMSDGVTITALARLEQRLVQHFQVGPAMSRAVC